MTRYLLDSNVIIDYLAGRPAVTTLLQQLNAQGDSFCICDVVAAEVYSGLLQRDWHHGQSFLSGMSYLTTTSAMAQQSGEWRFAFTRRGIQLSTTDCLIAGTAHGHRVTLLTGNTRDFPMPEITVVSTR